MRLSDIKRQVKSEHRFSIYIDNKYSFSLSQAEIVKNNLRIGKDIDDAELKQLKALAVQDKLYIQTMKLVAARPKSEWEVSNYLKRKGASPALIQDILNKLSNLDLIDDYKFAEMYARHLTLHSPASRRKILAKLKQKGVKEKAIESVLTSQDSNDVSALETLIKNKRKKYPDDLKLMAYLARQGFNYSDIKSAIQASKEV